MVERIRRAAPRAGNRKIYITLALVIPFLIVASVALFWIKADVTAWIKAVGEFLTYILTIFTGGNAVEHLSDAIKGKKQHDDAE